MIVMKTKEQLAEDKKIAMQYRVKPLKIEEGLRTAELKKIVSDLWANIIQLESDKYDLEEERKRQEYHLKELLERQKQINKNKALKMGLDVEDLSANVPPKVRLASKYERKVDRRSFGEKTSLFNGGYIKYQEEVKERDHEDKVNQFKESHGDKHVPKWDPSAPRKDTYEPGTIIYEESENEDDDELVDKLRSYVEEANKERRRSSQQQQQQIQKQQFDRDELSRRRSSQLSTASSQQSRQVSSQPPKEKQQEKVAANNEEDECDDEEYEYEDEEEYTTEEE